MIFVFCHSGRAAIRNPGVSRTNMNFKVTRKDYTFYVYILASKRNGTLYVGVTNSLFARSFQHKLKQDPKSFTAKYNIDKLVYHEIYKYIDEAIAREKELKKWKRGWKINLIEKDNPTWRDLFHDME
jgi:putative endonuclease